MSDPFPVPTTGTYLNINGIQVATESPYKDDYNNEKIMTSGRVLQEIDNAIINNAFNYVVDDIIEITYDSSSTTPSAPAADANTPDILFVHVVDTKATNPKLPYYELLQKITVSTNPDTFAYECNQVPVSSIVLDSRTEHKDIYTLYKYVEEVPSSGEVIPHYYQEWIKTNSAYNYVVNQVEEITYDSSSGNPPVVPTPTETSPEIKLYYFKDTKIPNPINYYELLIKYKENNAYAYKCYQAPISSIVLDLTNQDIYTLYNYYIPVPSTGEVVPNRYQNWIKTDHFNEDIQINLTHQDTSLTTKGHVYVGFENNTGKTKLLSDGNIETVGSIKILEDPTDTDAKLTVSSTGISATDTDTSGNTTTSHVLEILKNATASGQDPTGTSIEIGYTVDDTSTPANNVNETVKIDGYDKSLDGSNPGASIVVSGEHSYIQMKGSSQTIKNTQDKDSIELVDSTESGNTNSVIITTNPDTSASGDPSNSYASIEVSGTRSYVQTPILRLLVIN